MSVLTLAGKPIDWAKPPKATTRVMWSQRDMYGRAITGSLRTIAHLDQTNAAAVAKFGRGLVVFQPPFNKGVKVSAGTHDYDACLDVYIPGVDWWAQQRFFRERGWGAYYRRKPAFTTLHIHMFSLPLREGKDVSDDYREGGFKVGKLVDGGWSLYGKRTSTSQIASYYAHRDAMASNGPDTSWFPSDIKATIFNLDAYIRARREAARKAAEKTVRLPDSGVSFANVKGGDRAGKRSFAERGPKIAKQLTDGNKPVALVVELPNDNLGADLPSSAPTPLKILDTEMAKRDYDRFAYGSSAAAYARRGHVLLGPSRTRVLKTQHKGRKEAALDVIYGIPKVGWFTASVFHADVYASDALRQKQMGEVRAGNHQFATKNKKSTRQRLIATDHNTKSGAMVTYMKKHGWRAAAKDSRLAIFTRLTMPIFSASAEAMSSDHKLLRVVFGKIVKK